MRKFQTQLLVLVLIIGALVTEEVLGGEPTEESLIIAWEDIQKKDPKVVIFEKIESDLYRFHTTWFPFDGKLRLLNASIDEIEGISPKFCIGVVEVELIGLPDDFMNKYSRSYSIWSRNNTLYYDKKKGKWVSQKEWYLLVGKRSRSLVWTSYLWIIVPIAFLVLLLGSIRNSRIQMKKAFADQERVIQLSERSLQISERTVQIHQDNNRILKEILETLRNKG
jgi:hypothetical protein